VKRWAIAIAAVACSRGGDGVKFDPPAPLADEFSTFASASDDGTLYLIAQPGRRRYDGGDAHVFRRATKGWEEIAAPPATKRLRAHGDHLVALAGDVLYETHDGGKTWRKDTLPPAPFPDILETAQPPPPHYHDVALTPRGELYALAWDRIVRIADDGAAANVTVLANASPMANLVGLAATDDMIAISDNKGQVWRFDPKDKAIAPWSEGLGEPYHEGISAAPHLIRIGNRFVALRMRERFERAPGDAGWTLTGNDVHLGRGMCGIGDGWVEADDKGVRRIGADHATQWSIDPGVLVSDLACAGDDVVAGNFRATRALAGVIVHADGSHAPIALP
jgi:hypothetical protein